MRKRWPFECCGGGAPVRTSHKVPRPLKLLDTWEPRTVCYKPLEKIQLLESVASEDLTVRRNRSVMAAGPPLEPYERVLFMGSPSVTLALSAFTTTTVL